MCECSVDDDDFFYRTSLSRDRRLRPLVSRGSSGGGVTTHKRTARRTERWTTAGPHNRATQKKTVLWDCRRERETRCFSAHVPVCVHTLTHSLTGLKLNVPKCRNTTPLLTVEEEQLIAHRNISSKHICQKWDCSDQEGCRVELEFSSIYC